MVRPLPPKPIPEQGAAGQPAGEKPIGHAEGALPFVRVFLGIGGIILLCLFVRFVALPLIFAWQLGAFDPPEVQPRPFEAEAWKRADPIEPLQRNRTVRSQMIDDLLRRKLLDGLSRAEVEQLLGPPLEDLSGFKSHFRRYHLAYRLGLQRDGGALAFYYEYLAIRLDEQGRVTEYRDVRN
jgi:hypothetical protein